MRIRFSPLVPLLLLAAVPTLSAAPPPTDLPPNDDRENALLVPTDAFLFVQPTLGASLQTSEPDPCQGVGSTVWYRFTPVTSGIVRVNTHGSNFDTLLAVYVNGTSGLVPLTCNDDATGSLNGVTSQVLFRATEGQTYYIQAGGVSGSAGVLVLRVTPALVPV